MEIELALHLLVFWLSTTLLLCSVLSMWFANEGESFHPHCVDVDHRHRLFVVVRSRTKCKSDCCVKSISAFVAPRGSSSNKQFTVFSVMVSVAGFLGTFRWYRVGDGQPLEVVLALIGFASLLLLSAFEMDVMPEVFLEDKLMVTGWLIEKMRLEGLLDFDINDYHNEKFLSFIRASKSIYELYEEDHYLTKINTSYIKRWHSQALTKLLHFTGAVLFIVCLTAAILINEREETSVVWITGAFFFFFCLLGYLTGNYMPVLRGLRCWVMAWNPFLKEPHFMLLLKRAVEDYAMHKAVVGSALEAVGKMSTSPASPACEPVPIDYTSDYGGDCSSSGDAVYDRGQALGLGLHHRQRSSDSHGGAAVSSPLSAPTSPRFTAGRMRTWSTDIAKINSRGASSGGTGVQGRVQARMPATRSRTRVEKDRSKEAFLQASREVDASSLDNIALRFARNSPKAYLHILGRLFVMSELIAFLAPAIGMGIQWATALCECAPLPALLGLARLLLYCVFYGDCSQQHFQHCILE